MKRVNTFSTYNNFNMFGKISRASLQKIRKSCLQPQGEKGGKINLITWLCQILAYVLQIVPIASELFKNIKQGFFSESKTKCSGCQDENFLCFQTTTYNTI